MVRVRKLKRAGKIALNILLVSIIIAGVYVGGITRQQEVMVDNLLRLHIIANSDSPADQALKIDVKDRIVQAIGGEVKDLESKEQVVNYINNNLQRIEEIARNEIQAHNKPYPVKVEVGRFPFPTKLYGNLALPAGTYDALKVVIGEGKGTNWWCVMFPPLCFIDGKNGIAFLKDQQEVMEMLDREEYRILLSSRNMDEVPVRIRFKLVEIINRSRIKIAQIFGYRSE